MYERGTYSWVHLKNTRRADVLSLSIHGGGGSALAERWCTLIELASAASMPRVCCGVLAT